MLQMNRREIIKALEQNGYRFVRHGGNHDIYFSSETKKTIPIKRHEFNDNDAKYILKEAGILRGRKDSLQ